MLNKLVFHVRDCSGNVVVRNSQIAIDLSVADLVAPDVKEALQLGNARLLADKSLKPNDCYPELAPAEKISEMFESVGISIAKFLEHKSREWARSQAAGPDAASVHDYPPERIAEMHASWVLLNEAGIAREDRPDTLKDEPTQENLRALSRQILDSIHHPRVEKSDGPMFETEA
jgi:hypothetical protein